MPFQYAIVIGVAFVAEVIGIGLLYGMPSLVKDKAKTSMSMYKGIASSEVYSLAWNVIMIQFQCCGVDSYRDFNESNAWEKHPIPNNPSLTLQTPIACCKTLPSGTLHSDFMCAIQYNSLTSNGEMGCYDAVWKASFGNPAIAVPVLLVCALIQIVFVLSAISIIRAENRGVSPI
ncbi:hypothetical protein DPMN_194370 [Dreissena polymorpha]|uniref:Tetraspanin n=1 Tax=Dreissena polymorpha TaxID=45954 RepID=A0A9D3Y2J6_DREPO|nr:hypothetical protein DPMN_194370 [Dreissena polymorpha]